MAPTVALFDYGAGNIRSAARALEAAGAKVSVTAENDEALAADGLVVPGVGAFASCMAGLEAAGGPRVVGQRLAGGRPVLGICVGLQVLFGEGSEHGETAKGLGEWPGRVERLHAPVLPHMGWNTVSRDDRDPRSEGAPARMFAGIDPGERFYFVHSYGVRRWELRTEGLTRPPAVWWASHGGDEFVAAVENGPLWACQFHPEKSGPAGLKLLGNWVATLTPRAGA